jgi:DNA primase
MDQTVWVVEGERDANTLREHELIATTNAGGAEKWKNEYNEALRGRPVVILPDNDEPGRRHARQVAAALAGIGASVVTVELPDLPEKGDVSDWFAAGGTASTLRGLAVQAASRRDDAAAGGTVAG